MPWNLDDDEGVERRVVEALDVKDACRHYLQLSTRERWWFSWRVPMGRQALFDAADDLAQFALECLDRKHRDSFLRLQALAAELP